MNVVVVDSGNLTGEFDFPMLNLNKFGWEQYLALDDDDELEQRCWRTDVIVSASTPIDRKLIEKSFKLKLIVTAGESTDHIDLEAARERGIKVCNTPGLLPDNSATTQQLCNEVVNVINAFINNEDVNLVN